MAQAVPRRHTFKDSRSCSRVVSSDERRDRDASAMPVTLPTGPAPRVDTPTALRRALSACEGAVVGSGLMWRGALQVSLLVLSLGGGLIRAAEPGSPEDVLGRYLQALKAEKFDEVYDLISSTMRQGRSKELYVKEFQAMMGVADFKIFDFTVYPAKIEGEKALVPNILESQDRFINTLGLTEHELYTLVREGGAWRVDAQTLVDPPDRAKWFPKQGGKAPDTQADKPEPSQTEPTGH